MSGSTIGGAVGAVIGFVATGYNPEGARWGWVATPAIFQIVALAEKA